MAPTTTQAIRSAVTIIRTESLSKRNGMGSNLARVALAWRVLELASGETRRDLVIVALGIKRDALYGGSSVPGFGGSISAVVTGT